MMEYTRVEEVDERHIATCSNSYFEPATFNPKRHRSTSMAFQYIATVSFLVNLVLVVLLLRGPTYSSAVPFGQVDYSMHIGAILPV